MIDYLVQCAGLSLVALLAVACLRSAPAHWRLRAMLVALFVTTLPWTLLPAIPVTVASGPSPVLDILAVDVPLVTPDVGALPVSAMPPEAWRFPLVLVLSVASGLGLAAFALLALRQQSTLRRWRAMARDGDHLLREVPEPLRNCRIRILPRGSQAVATGLLRPTVWIGERRLDDERRASILLHESMHLHRRHPHIAVTLTFLRCLFWWQPFVWLWVWLARRELEHDCDEACAEILGRDHYRTTLASLVHDAVPQPGLALMGRGSFNLRRVKRLATSRLPSLRHRVAVTVALCLTPLLVLDVSVDAKDDDGVTRAELVETLENVAAETGADGTFATTGNGMIGFHFNTNLAEALQQVADAGSRPIYLHPDAASHREVRLTVAGDQDEVVRAVAEHVGLTAIGMGFLIGLDGISYPIGGVVAEERSLTTLDWIDRAIVLVPVSKARVRMDIHLEIDGRTIATPVDLVMGRLNLIGFEAQGYRFNIIAHTIAEEGVEIELRTQFGSRHQAMWHKSVPYSRRLPPPEDANAAGWGDRHELHVWTTVVDGKLPDTEGESHDVELRMAAYRVDHGRAPFPDGADESS